MNKKELMLDLTEEIRRRAANEGWDQDVERDVLDLVDRFEAEILDILEGARENYERQRNTEYPDEIVYKEDMFDCSFRPKTTPVTQQEDNLWFEYGLDHDSSVSL